jgi:hypothetical protein
MRCISASVTYTAFLKFAGNTISVNPSLELLLLLSQTIFLRHVQVVGIFNHVQIVEPLPPKRWPMIVVDLPLPIVLDLLLAQLLAVHRLLSRPLLL